MQHPVCMVQVAAQEAALAQSQSSAGADSSFRAALDWCQGMAGLLASLSGVRLLDVAPDCLRMRLTTAAGAWLLGGVGLRRDCLVLVACTRLALWCLQLQGLLPEATTCQVCDASQHRVSFCEGPGRVWVLVNRVKLFDG